MTGSKGSLTARLCRVEAGVGVFLGELFVPGGAAGRELWLFSPNISNCLTEGDHEIKQQDPSLGSSASGRELHREISPNTNCGLGFKKGLL